MSEERLSFVEVVELVGTKYSEPLAQAQMRLWAACISRKITRHYDDERAAAQAGKVRAEIKAKAARHAPTKARPDAAAIQAEAARLLSVVRFSYFDRASVFSWLGLSEPVDVREATDAETKDFIKAVLEDPTTGNPNNRDLWKHVLPRMKDKHLTKAKNRIESLGKGFKTGRRQRGEKRISKSRP